MSQQAVTSRACDIQWGMLFPRWLGTSMTPNWRHWFEAEPLEKGKGTAPGFCFRVGVALVAEGYWEAFRGATFFLIPALCAPGTSK